MGDEKKQPPVIDLHESEWRRPGKREPIFGPNAKQFLIYAISMPIGWWITVHVLKLLQ